ncbi:MAG: agmatinase [Methanomicrobiales archaeon]|nr:agmatinase [Methanomicrobiales archaeon]
MTTLFADAKEEEEQAKYVILGVPYDGTTSFRPGTRYGPRAIREYSCNFESYMPHHHVDLISVPFFDRGDLEPECSPERVVAQVEQEIEGIIQRMKVPILLGGEHSITIGAVRAARPDVYIVCDAHLDLREEYRGSLCNHACTTARVLEDGVEDAIVIGARSGTEEQYRRAHEMTIFDADDVATRGIGTILEEIMGMVEGRKIYLSIDADVVDCCLTPGVGTPEPFGITPRDLRAIVRTLGPLSSAFDYVEVCPVDAGQTAAVAAEMIREFIAAHWVRACAEPPGRRVSSDTDKQR